MATKDIRTSGVDAHATCDVCGRTLLRGEHAHPYLDGGTHRTVCELCTGRAQQEGWIREGAMPAYEGRDSARDRRRSLLGRLRKRREDAAEDPAPAEPEYEQPERWAPAPTPARAGAPIREPRHVRAIPSSADQKASYAIDAFNASEHPRTIAGIARSLGLPSVSVRPVADRPSMVHVVAAWELCWYRYEIDLAEEDPGGVRIAAQGDELSELDDEELETNALCDDDGMLALDA